MNSVQTTYAGVCLLDSPYAIDGVYDYAIPADWASEVFPGRFVTVPFGSSNHPKTALVVEVRDRSAYPKVKKISSVCPCDLSLDEEMLGLCRFMKQRTLCTVGDAVRAIVPTSALSKLTICYASAPTDAELSPAEDAVVRYLSENGEATERALVRNFGQEVFPVLRSLERQGAISKRSFIEDGAAEQIRRTWIPAVEREIAQTLLDGGSANGKKLTSEKQRIILSAVLAADEPLTSAELCERTDGSESSIRTLQKNGILQIREERVERNPYAGFVYKGQTPLTLNEEQGAAFSKLKELSESGEPRAALLYGVTGSGKTSVMTAFIDDLLSRGRGVILLLPEIALTPQSVSIFCSRYGDRVAVIHSGLSAGERYDAYCRIKRGDADVVIGTRSAVFAPMKNLGAIIIDEEQEHTYKSDRNPKYHARDIARYRCNAHRAVMLLSSATPSVESFKKAKDGVYTLLRLSHRYGAATLPKVSVVDMRKEIHRGNATPLGEELVGRMIETARRGEQSILFLNRRGYNHFVSCRDCGKAILCPNCSVAMTYHTRKGTYEVGDLVCHWCGTRRALPRVCPECSSEHLVRMGFGTQRVEEEIGKLLPNAKLLRMDTDTTSTKFAYDEMLTDFRNHKADILLGTQMVTKGHDFPDVTLVGVLLADLSLYLDDYRAAERTFAMLTQVIGRAGRSEKEGLAIIQTDNPDNEIIRLAQQQDYDTFFEREIRLRKLLTFPPFCDIVLLTVTGSVEDDLLRAAGLLSRQLIELVEGDFKDVKVVTFGPFEAPVYRVENKYRMRIVVKCALNKRAYLLFDRLLCLFSEKGGKQNTLGVDFNPSNL